MLYSSTKKNRQAFKPKEKPVKVINNDITLAQKSWIVQAQTQLQQQKDEIKKLKQAQLELQEKLKREEEKKKDNKNNNPLVQAIVGKNNNTQPAVSVNYPPPPMCKNGEPCGEHTPPTPTVKQTNDMMGVVSVEQSNQQQNSQNREQKKKSNNPDSNLAKVISNGGKKIQKVTAQINGQKQKLIIPPGSFVKAVLLSGADVPTMGNGSVGPIPIMLRVTSMAQMPNFWKANIKSCFLIGQATGSLSAERAYIRINKLSCVKNDGKPLVRSVKAYVTGADGKVGIAGRVVSKQGSMLARTLVAGFVKGVGEAFNESQTTVSISPLGSTQSVAPDTHTILRYGIGGGVSKATEELAKFYMKMANQMFPVIEINAGKDVDVVFLDKVNLSEEGRNGG